MIYTGKFALCMNDNSDWVEIPRIAEAKEPVRPSEQVIALRRNIQAYADSHASLLEKIGKKSQTIDELTFERSYLRESNLELRRQNGSLGRTIHDLRVQVAELREEVTDLRDVANNNYNAYKKQCIASGHAGQHVHELKQELYTAKQKIERLQTSNKLLTSAITLLKK